DQRYFTLDQGLSRLGSEPVQSGSGLTVRGMRGHGPILLGVRGSRPMQPTPLSALSDNYIWTLPGDAGRFLVVDPGEAGPVLAAAAGGRTPAAVLLTHHHDDHIGGVPSL